MKRIFAIALLICGVLSTNAKAECLPVDGLIFEKVGRSTLLMIRGGRNIGLLKIWYGEVPQNFSLRFFMPTICDSTENRQFQINGELVTVELLQLFK